jgi:protein-disulfide isomerase
MDQKMNPFTLTVPVNATDHVLGPANAAVTVVEYGDFECPYCKQAYPVAKLMLSTFKDDLRFVFRHYPLTEVHPLAEIAAEAAEAAGAQASFWPMHDLLLENQRHLKPKHLRNYAQRLELDLERYDYDMSEHVYLQRVREHFASGERSGVRSTPAFFIDGAILDTSFGFQVLVDAVKAALERSITYPRIVNPRR